MQRTNGEFISTGAKPTNQTLFFIQVGTKIENTEDRYRNEKEHCGFEDFCPSRNILIQRSKHKTKAVHEDRKKRKTHPRKKDKTVANHFLRSKDTVILQI